MCHLQDVSIRELLNLHSNDGACVAYASPSAAR